MLKQRCKKCGRYKGKNHKCPDIQPMQGVHRFGKENPNWKGGVVKINGYLMEKHVYHPFANKQGYVMQHRLIMEKYIERFVLPQEVVHHINGIRNDNRIENLQLLNNLGEHNILHKTK